MIRWTGVPLQHCLGEHVGAWDALNAQSFGNHPLLTSMFVDGLLRHFGDGTEHMYRLEAQGQIQAMCILRQRSLFAWASFLPSQAQIGLTLIPDEALLPSLVRSLPVTAIVLDLLCNDPAVGGVVSSSTPATNRLNHSLTMDISLSGSFAEYWATRSKKLQSNIKRYFQRAKTDGIPWRMNILESPGDMSAAVVRYGQLEMAGWKGLRGTALPCFPEQLDFYLELMQSAAQQSHAKIFELWFGDTLVASRIALLQDRMLVMLKTTYSEQQAQHSPGGLLLRLVIEHAFDAWPGGRIEFYTDATEDQLAWATDKRWVQHATVLRCPAAVAPIAVMRMASKRQAPPPTGDATVPGVDAYHHPDALPSEAIKLMARSEKINVELGLTWYRNLVKTVYPTHTGVRFYVLRHGTQVVAVLPLRAEKVRRGWRLESLSNYYTSLYEPVLVNSVKPKDLTVLLATIRRDFPGCSSFRFAPMDPSSHAYQTLLAAFRLKGWMPFEFFAFGNWYLPVQQSWQEYLMTRTGQLRSTIKRMSKKFAGDGGTLQLVTSTSDTAAAIASYEKVYASSWKKPEPFIDFLPGLLQTCAEHAWLRLGLAWLNGQPIAAQLWIVAHGRAEIYKVAYDENFKSYSPGTLLTAVLMEHVFDQDKVFEVDYLIGDDPYKKTWMSHRRERWGIVAYNLGSLGGFAGFAREALGRWAKPWLTAIRTKLAAVALVNDKNPD